jgi:hypothetical protein
MQAGMMWFDNDKQTSLAAKINKAAAYYRKKYGRSPNLCMVNPKMLDEKDEFDEKIVIRAYQPIVTGHLWIGIDDSRVIKKKIEKKVEV